MPEKTVTEAELKMHLEAAEKSPKQAAAAVLGLPESVLRFKPAPNQWCILEILGHLADIEIVFGQRIRQMMAESNPTITGIDQEAWARALGYMETPVPETIALYGLNRHHNLRLLRKATLEQLAKSAYHPKMKQEITLADMAERLDSHSAKHLQQIEKLKKQAK